jgi:glycosyltransferase involved in cell wall biosynthesis
VTVLHVTPTFYPAARFGGPIVSLRGLCDALAVRGDTEITVLTSDSSGFRSSERLSQEEMASAREELAYPVAYRRKTCGAEFSISMLAAIAEMVAQADVVHISYAYSWSSLAALRACVRAGVSAVWTPRGALQGWSERRKRRLKRLWDGYALRLCRHGNVVLHFTSDAEAADSIAAMPGVRHVVVQNGVDIPPVVRHAPRAGSALRVLYLGRLHPIKALGNLLSALARTGDDITLDICGDGDAAYRAELEARILRERLGKRVRLHGHVDGPEKESLLQTADLLVLPSHTENFGMAAAEALACGIPVLASTGTPWQELDARGCGRCVPNDAASLAAALRQMQGMDLEAMGERGREWMRSSFSWEASAEAMHDVYTSMLKPCA